MRFLGTPIIKLMSLRPLIQIKKNPAEAGFEKVRINLLRRETDNDFIYHTDDIFL